MRRASSGEEFEWEKTSATKSIRFGTWIVTMSGFLSLYLGLDRPRLARDHPASHADFTIGFLGTFSEKSAACLWPRRKERCDYIDLTGAMHRIDSIVANLRSLEFDTLLFRTLQFRQAALELMQHILQLGEFAGA